MYLFILIAFIIIIFLHNLFNIDINNKNTIEGLENNKKNCDTELNTTIYRNAGAIDNLKQSVDTMMKQVNQLILQNEKQDTKISNLQTLQQKYDKVAEQAQKLSDANKQRLIAFADRAKRQSQQAQSQANQIPSPGGGPTPQLTPEQRQEQRQEVIANR